MMNKIKNNIYRLLLAVAVCFAAWSCSGEEEALMPQLPQVPADPDALCTITPGAIEIDYVDASEAPLTRSATGEPLQKATQIQNLGHNLSVEATLEAVPQEAQTRAAEPMVANAYYRIVVFNGSGAVEGNVVYKQVSGKPVLQSTTPIKLRAGTYRLFCYSFNSTTYIRGLNSDQKNVSVNPGDDFMTYTNANFTVAPTDYASGKTINISFTRQCTRLTVKVNSFREDGATDYISAATMTISSSFGSTNWNGATNDDTSTLPSQTGNANLVKAVSSGSLSLYCGPATGNKYLITSPTTNQTVYVTNLKISYSGENVAPPSGYPVKFTNITLSKGQSYELVINVHNFYELTASNPVKIGNVEWAWTNLWYSWNAPVFRDYPWGWDPEIAYRYWNWGVRYPGNSNTGNNSWTETRKNHENQDPCIGINGEAEKWRLPTRLQLDNLTVYKAPRGTKIKINNQFYNVDNDYGYAKYINGSGALEEAGTVFIDGDQVLYLHAEGYRDDIYAIKGTIEGYIWSSDHVPNNTGLAYLLKFCETDLKTYDGERFYGRSVRCVRNY